MECDGFPGAASRVSLAQPGNRSTWTNLPTLPHRTNSSIPQAGSARPGIASLRRQGGPHVRSGFRSQTGCSRRKPKALSSRVAAMVTATAPGNEVRSQSIQGASAVMGKFWVAVETRPFRRTPQPLPRYTVVMTTQCRDQLTEQLRGSVRRGHEGIVYFVGLTGLRTARRLVLSAMAPEHRCGEPLEASTYPQLSLARSSELLPWLSCRSEWGNFTRIACGAYHSDGDRHGDENTSIPGTSRLWSNQLRCSASVVQGRPHPDVDLGGGLPRGCSSRSHSL